MGENKWRKNYNITIYGESESNFNIEATEEDIQAFGRVMNTILEKTHTGELYSHVFIV